jgi:hypothetical protein
MIRYKLFRVRKDGSIGPLFIDARRRIMIGEWMEAETHHRKKGFAYRPGWHCTEAPVAPHLSMKGRQWFVVETEGEELVKRPPSQGGYWIIADRIKVIGEVK